MAVRIGAIVVQNLPQLPPRNAKQSTSPIFPNPQRDRLPLVVGRGFDRPPPQGDDGRENSLITALTNSGKGPCCHHQP